MLVDQRSEMTRLAFSEEINAKPREANGRIDLVLIPGIRAILPTSEFGFAVVRSSMVNRRLHRLSILSSRSMRTFRRLLNTKMRRAQDYSREDIGTMTA